MITIMLTKIEDTG